MSKVPIYCVEENEKDVDIMGIDWYDGSESFVDSNAPSLAVGFSNGKVQIMKFGPILYPLWTSFSIFESSWKWN